jgi:hypothetical protein
MTYAKYSCLSIYDFFQVAVENLLYSAAQHFGIVVVDVDKSAFIFFKLFKQFF